MGSGVGKKLSNEKLVVGFLAIYLIISVVWHFLTDAPWDDDCVTRYFNAKNAFNDPSEFINPWNRPLFILIFSVPFQISKHLILLMAVFSSIGAYYLYKTLEKKQFTNAHLIVPLLLFQTFYFTISRSSLAEPLVAVIMSLGYYFLTEKKYLWFAIIGSLIPLARLELSPLLLFWAYYIVKEKQIKLLVLLGIPTLLWNFAGTIMEGDPLWLYNAVFTNDNGVNRYGQTTFGHYFHRSAYVVGPIIFYFFMIGFVGKLMRRKTDLFVIGQLVLGFTIYVVFSWKLSLGNAAGFLRHLATLSPFVAIAALQGYNYWLAAIQKKAVEDKTTESSEKDEVNEEKNEKDEIQKRIEEIKRKGESGELKKRTVKHLLRKHEGMLLKLENEVDEKEPRKVEKKSILSSIRILIYSLIMCVLAYFFFSQKLKNHHVLLEDKQDYTILIALSILTVLFGLLLITAKKIKSKGAVTFGLNTSLVLSLILFTGIQESPDSHNSPERKTMSKVARIYYDSYLSNHPTYFNHSWITWVGGERRENFKTLNQENLNAAPDSSIIIWESHYSNRLSGDVPIKFLSNNPEYIELAKSYSETMTFTVLIYQKITGKKEEEDYLAIHDRFIRSAPELSDAYVSRAKTKSNVLDASMSALEDCNKALEMNPNNLEAFFQKGVIYHGRKEYRESLKNYKLGIAVQPDYFMGYYNIAVIEGTMGNNEEALEYFTKALERNKVHSKIYLERGKTYCRMDNFEKGIEEFNTFLDESPEDRDGYYFRGYAYLKTSKVSEGCVDLRKSQQLGHAGAKRLVEKFCK